MKRQPLERNALELSVHMFGGILTALNWIEQDAIEAPDEEIRNARGALVLAGAELAMRLKERL
jgi:hypothetical protein